MTQIFGGLGNQMLQYSIGRALALRLSTDLLLDMSWFVDQSGYTSRNYSLSSFPNLKGASATQQQYDTFAYHILWKQVFRKIQARPGDFLSIAWKDIFRKYLLELYSREKVLFAQEKAASFNEKVAKLQGNVYLSGYWLTDRYFKDIKETLINDFTFPPFINEKAATIAREISTTESIALHVRCGDYIKNKRYRNYFNILGPTYYHTAIHTIQNSLKDCRTAKVFIFSDEPLSIHRALSLDKIGIPYVLVNIHSPDEAVHDLHLMSLCKHAIVANSTFSWWGAWLNQNPEKIVMCPARYFARESLNIKAKDIYPEEWIKIGE